MDFTAGDMYGKTMLGSSALYRVLRSDGKFVWVEVVRAPGLQPGEQLRLTQAAVSTMRRMEYATVEDAVGGWIAVA